MVLKGALSMAEIDEINAALDALPKMRLGEWFGHAHMTSGPGDISLQQLYELGEPFEIVHVTWDCKRAPTTSANLFGDGIDVGGGARGEHAVGSGVGEAASDRCTYAFSCARDDRDATVQPKTIQCAATHFTLLTR